jgi:predicted DNA-binding protein
MQVRTTIDIPGELHEKLRRRAEQTGASIRSLVIGAIEQTYGESEDAAYVTGPLVTGHGELGPAFPVDENPHDLVFS